MKLRLLYFLTGYYTLLVVFIGCGTSENVTDTWQQKVEAGEYGWVDFTTMDKKNLDIFPEPVEEQFTDKILETSSARECIYRLFEKENADRFTLLFLIDEKGTAQRFYLNNASYKCRRNAFYTLNRVHFRPGYRNGEPVPVVGKVTILFNYRELGKLEGIH